MFLAVLFAGVTLLAGSYSALALARVRPMTALRLATMRVGSSGLRRLLVGSQFALASFLVVAVVVLFSQRADLRQTLLGRFADQYVFVWPGTSAGIDRDVLATELRKGTGIKGVTGFGFPPWQFQGSRPRYSSSPGEDQPMLTTEYGAVGYDYFDVMDIPLLAGRVFARERNDETTYSPQAGPRSTPRVAVLDRIAARALGWANPADAIGKTIYEHGDPTTATEVIGVVDSVPIAIRDRGSDGIVYRLMPQRAAVTIIRVAKEEVKAATAHIDDVFKTLSPTRSPPSRMFLDQAFETAYYTFDLINRVFLALGAFAIAIAAVGLFGMASYMTSRRTREIGLRKTQGATSRQILELLLWDFSKPVLVANLLVWPFALFAAERYLDSFAQRMTLGPWPFFVALLATLLVAFGAVVGRVLRASRLRPTEALRED